MESRGRKNHYEGKDLLEWAKGARRNPGRKVDLSHVTTLSSRGGKAKPDQLGTVDESLGRYILSKAKDLESVVRS